MKLNGLSVAITGGVSGLGLATAQRVIDAGGLVTLIDLPTSDGQAVADGLGAAASFAAADITDREQFAAALDVADDRGGLRGLVHCAGAGRRMRILDKEGKAGSVEDFEFVIKLNLVGSFHALSLGAERIARQEPVDGERGAIIMTASVAAYEGQIGQAAYSSSKGGVVGLTLPVARDLAAVGIRVNTVAPGLIDTPIYGEGPESEAFKAKLGESVLYPRRLGKPEELASMVVELITNSYMNAEVVRVDGGIRMPPK